MIPWVQIWIGEFWRRGLTFLLSYPQFVCQWVTMISLQFLLCRTLCMANNFCNRILFIPILFLILLWTSGDKKLHSRVGNDFIPFLQIFADVGLLRSTSWLCANGFLFVHLALILSLGAGLYKDFLEIPEFEPLVSDAILKFPTIGLGSVFL